MPLVLHNVPDEELYIGKDGIRRPYALIETHDERRGARLRKQAAANHGSFGRARIRPTTGSFSSSAAARVLQPPKKPSLTLLAADQVFGSWKKEQELIKYKEKHGPDAVPGGGLPPVRTPPINLVMRKMSEFDGGMRPLKSKAPPKPPNQPTEVILRGYRSPDYQYAVIKHYEQLAGRICEDYPREPPPSNRQYQMSVRDAARRDFATIESNGRLALTPAERKAVMQRAASGEHWVKITFESAQAAEAAVAASPQVILGHLVSAEMYRGVPPTDDSAVLDPDAVADYEEEMHADGEFRDGSVLSGQSSQTADSGTVTSGDLDGAGRRPGGFGRRRRSSAHEAGNGLQSADNDGVFCRKIPTARRVTLMSSEQALLPCDPPFTQFLKQVPVLNRLTGTIIGNQVPRREDGLFDWEKASLYWKLIWWLDFLFALFGGEILDANKED